MVRISAVGNNFTKALSAFKNEKTMEIFENEFALITEPMTVDELTEKLNGLDVISKYMFV